MRFRDCLAAVSGNDRRHQALCPPCPGDDRGAAADLFGGGAGSGRGRPRLIARNRLGSSLGAGIPDCPGPACGTCHGHSQRRGTEHGSGLGVHRWVVEQSIALLHWFRPPGGQGAAVCGERVGVAVCGQGQSCGVRGCLTISSTGRTGPSPPSATAGSARKSEDLPPPARRAVSGVRTAQGGGLPGLPADRDGWPLYTYTGDVQPGQGRPHRILKAARRHPDPGTSARGVSPGSCAPGRRKRSAPQ